MWYADKLGRLVFKERSTRWRDLNCLGKLSLACTFDGSAKQPARRRLLPPFWTEMDLAAVHCNPVAGHEARGGEHPQHKPATRSVCAQDAHPRLTPAAHRSGGG